MLSIDWSLFPGVSVSGEPLRHARLFLLCPRMPPNFSQRPWTRKSRPPDADNWIKSAAACACVLLIGSRCCQSKYEPSSAVRRQVKLALRGKRDRENLVRLNFLSRFSFIYEYFLQRILLTPGVNTFQDEEPQVSIKKARSNYHSKLITLVFFRGNYSKFC